MRVFYIRKKYFDMWVWMKVRCAEEEPLANVKKERIWENRQM